MKTTESSHEVHENSQLHKEACKQRGIVELRRAIYIL